MRRVAIIQARMNSTRLPGKVLLDIAGRAMLEQQIRRLNACRSVDDLVVATTSSPDDDPIVHLAERLNVQCFRGDELDVLGRFSGAARVSRADVIARITADCPLIDPVTTDRVIDELVEGRAACDYASNIVRRTYPRGLDVEAFFSDTLFRMDRLARSAAAREHVTILARSELPDLFLVHSVEDENDNSDLRWTVDAEVDLQLVRGIYEILDLDARVAAYPEILAFARAHPELSRLNADVETWSPPARAI